MSSSEQEADVLPVPAAHQYVNVKMHESQLPLHLEPEESLQAEKSCCGTHLRAYLVLVGGFLVLNGVCGMYAFGNIVPYMASYWTYYQLDQNPQDCTHSDQVKHDYNSFTNKSVWTYTSLMVLWNLFAFFGGQFELLCGPKKATFSTASIVLACIALTYFTCHNFYLTSLTFGALMGLSLSLIYTPPIVVAMRWWPHNRAMATSVVTLGTSTGAVWVSWLETIFINPNNVAEDPNYGFVCKTSIMERYPQVFLILGATLSAVMLVGGSLMANPPHGYQIDTKIKVIDDKNVSTTPNKNGIQSQHLTRHHSHRLQHLQHSNYVHINDSDDESGGSSNRGSSANTSSGSGSNASGSSGNSANDAAHGVPSSKKKYSIPTMPEEDGVLAPPMPQFAEARNSTSTLGTIGTVGTVGTIGTIGTVGTTGTIGTIGTTGTTGTSGTTGTTGTSATLTASLTSATGMYGESGMSLIEAQVSEEKYDSFDQMMDFTASMASEHNDKFVQELESGLQKSCVKVTKVINNSDGSLEQNLLGVDEKQKRAEQQKQHKQHKQSKHSDEKQMHHVEKHASTMTQIEVPRSKEEIARFLEDNIEKFAFTKREAVCSRKFWCLFFICMLNAVNVSFVSSEWKIFANDYLDITDDEFLVLLASFSAVFGAIGKILFSALLDYSKSFKLSMGTLTFMLCVFVSSICVSGLYYSKELCFVWICVLSTCTTGSYVLYPSAASKAFGIKNSGVIIGFIFSSEVPAVILEAVLYDDIEGIVGSWLNFSIIMGACAGLSFILALSFDGNNAKKVKFLKDSGVWHLRK